MKIIFILIRALLIVVYAFSAFLFCATNWIYSNVDVDLFQIEATLKNDIKGFDFSTLINTDFYKQTLIFLFFAFLLIFLIYLIKKYKTSFLRLVSLIIIVGFSFIFLYSSLTRLSLFNDLSITSRYTSIYEDYFVNANDVSITKNGDTNNLLCIYLESMETSLEDTEYGNVIPYLTQLQKDNISFSYYDNGYRTVENTHFTLGALLATTRGIPSYSNYLVTDEKPYQTEIVTLGDILKDNGYTNEFLCGSDGDFANRKKYFQDNGDYYVFDYFEAVDKGYIDEDYFVFWGLEDEILYNIAKDELTRISKENKLFNFTMLTVDTHYPEGYICDLCNDGYDIDYLNVFSCADRQISSFLEWCSQQDWYDNTTIVILGDHPTMSKTLIPGMSVEDRMVYNCFINSKKSIDTTTNKLCTTVDMFPTILSSLGFSIEGNKLGFGTDLFSNEDTYAKTIGFEDFSKSFMMKSLYQEKYFMNN